MNRESINVVAELLFRANHRYWRGAPAAREIRVTIVPSAQTRANVGQRLRCRRPVPHRLLSPITFVAGI